MERRDRPADESDDRRGDRDATRVPRLAPGDDGRSPQPSATRVQAAIRGRLIVSVGELIVDHFALVKERITIGRRPYNDLSLDDLTVSGEHASVITVAGISVIQDLGSRNGTMVNGAPVHRHTLSDQDVVDIGIYRLRFLIERVSSDTGDLQVGTVAFVDTATVLPNLDQNISVARVQMLNGAHNGTEVLLERPITSIGNAGVQVAVISRRKAGYFLTHLEGPSLPLVNGEPIGLGAHPLAEGDMIELAGTMLRFRLRG